MAETPDEVYGCSSYPLSFPSEPPDIKHWFSSYEYGSPEAPELIGNSGDDGSSSETQDVLERLEPELALSKAETEDASTALPENGGGDGSEHEIFARGELTVRMCESKGDGKAKGKQCLRQLFGVEFLGGCQEDVADSQVSLSAERGQCRNQEQRAGLPVDSTGISSAGTEGSQEDEVDHGEPLVPCSGDKESEESVAADGFISTKSKEKLREEDKRSDPHMPLGGRGKPMLQENNDNLERKVRVQGGSRSPLGDRTNLIEAAAAPTPEFCGKWKCPRKSKPYIGPPLKQMRLEQWVHRVK